MKKTVILTLFLLPMGVAWGQTGFSARSMGMAGAYQGMSRGAEVSLWNPANLALPDGPRMSVDLLGVAMNLGNNSFSLSLYNDYFSENYFDEHESWDEAAKNTIIGEIPSGGLKVYNRLQITSLAFSYEQYALALNTFCYADGQLPQDLLEVPLQGLGTEPVNLTDIEGEAIFGTEIVLSGSRMLHPDWDWLEYLTVGASFKYFIGHAYATLDEAGGVIISNPDTIAVNGNYKAFLVAPFDDKGKTGRGVGLDLGSAAKINEKLTVGLSIHNFFGSIHFDGAEEYLGSFAFNEKGLNQDEFDNFGDYLDSVAVDNDTSFASGEDLSYALPKSFTLSGTYRLNPKITVEADYQQGLNNTAGGTTTPRLAAGAEARFLSSLPIRFGFALGGIQGTTLAFGFGLDLKAYQLDFGFAYQRGLFYGSKGINFALSQRITL